MLQRRRLLVPDVDAGAAQLARLQRRIERGLVGDAAARRGHEDGALLHAGDGRRIDHAQRFAGARTVDRDEIGLREQFLQRHRTRAAPGDLVGADIRIVGQHGHAEGGRKARDARADMADADQSDGLAGNVVPHQVFTRIAAVAPQAPVAFVYPLRQRQHHAERVLGDRARVHAGLVDDDDAGLAAGVDIDGVVAGAAGRDADQLGAARQQFGGREPLPRQFVFGRRNHIDVRVAEIGPGARLGALARAGAQLDIGFARQPLGHGAIVGKVKADDDFRIGCHRTLKITPAPGAG